eukprot:TRINITY_DN2632_c0_g1_i2.p1 TRINITY_DN2632_c0_g1~~TRINITY_DN2632_c0_g1_i2.p1  ORF type:complete len:785 (+),score=163.33 TRINITY_DN2632_c0_g1_i2:312-2666(+)
MDSDLVIKVKYGNTLRRFSTHGHGSGSIDLNMGRLRTKIHNLFNFSPDADLTLTYIDEDGDIVTLVDDSDLCDAMNQGLNPLRIDVLLNTNRAGNSNPRSQGRSSTPTSSPQTQNQPSTHISSGVDEFLKSMPAPIHDAFSKLSHDLMSKAASSAPALIELVEYFSKLGHSNSVPLSQVLVGAPSSTHSSVSLHPMDVNASKGPDAFSDADAMLYALPKANSGDQTTANIPKDHDSDNMTRVPSVSAANSSAKLQSGISIAADSSVNAAAAKYLMDFSQESSSVSNKHKLPVPSINHYGSPDVFLPNNNELFPAIGVPHAALQIGFHPRHTRHLRKGPSDDAVAPGFHCPAYPFKSDHGLSESFPRTFHRGVQCDGCGMYPIVGPRFKSKVKEDYDLCNICFSQMGNEADYTRMDRATYNSPRLFKEFYPFQHPRYSSPAQAIRCPGMKPARTKLESRFIQDVTILDGTQMAPAASFTKIWRMRNNGTVAWPHGTQLVWIGGDQFGTRGSVELEIPVSGYPANEELDIAVDFMAPSNPGRYVSYWKMASPSGQKFGQRVWVLIQVDNSLQDSSPNPFLTGLNLNLPPGSSEHKGKEIIDVNVEPTDGGEAKSDHSNVATESIMSLIDENLGKSEEHGFIDSFLGGTVAAPDPATSAAYPAVDYSLVPSEPSPPIANVPSPVPDGAVTDAALTEDSAVEQNLLKELEEMGFKQIDLNKEVLRMNEYNLEQSLDDLCGISEWDPILEELQEMGFCDKEMNKKLLIKNGGSLKRVVLDLIAWEKKVE